MTGVDGAIVIGGGMAGASVAAHLSSAMPVLLLEAEAHPAMHSTGRSAAAFIPTYGASNDALRLLTALSVEPLQSALDGAAAGPLLRKRGLLTIVPRAQEAAAQAEFDQLAQRFAGLHRCSAGDERFDRIGLSAEFADSGWFEDEVSDIDVDLLLQTYLKQLHANGGKLLCSSPVHAVRRVPDGWHIETGHGTHRARVLINCAGAWADHVAVLAGARPQNLTPMRRTAILFRHPDGRTVDSWPLVLCADNSFYVKPDAGLLLASPVDETPSDPCDAQPEELDIATAAWRVEQAFGFSIRTIEHRWAGLRTFAPDRTPVIGPDPDVPDFYWLAGQGGHGIQTAPAAARLLASTVLQQPLPQEFRTAGFAPEWVAPRS